MLKLENQTINGWPDYSLVDSGEGMKLERLGKYLIARPDTQAIWQKHTPQKWSAANAVYTQKESRGAWKKTADIPSELDLSYGDVGFYGRLQSFKHIGFFPEQAGNWDFISDRVKQLDEPKVLNLFGYTGLATLVAAKSGALVTHVDASRQSLDQASENAMRAEIDKNSIRWIPDDALAFARRELRRGVRYNGIVLDPPAFGRGAKGQVWHIEEDLPKLMSIIKELLIDEPGSFLVLNGYASGYSAATFAELVKDYFPKLKGTYGELLIEQEGGARRLPSGIFVRGSL